MQNTNDMKTSMAPRRLPHPAETNQRRSDPSWKPEPCGLTQRELRKITIDLIG